jgi:hypothetical protein
MEAAKSLDSRHVGSARTGWGFLLLTGTRLGGMVRRILASL